MKKLSGQLLSSLYHIKHNKLYAVFCITGTAFTFIFVVLLLQLLYISSVNYPPKVYADRTIQLNNFTDEEGNNRIINPDEIFTLLNDLKDYEYAAMLNEQTINIVSKGHLYFSMVGFVNEDFWNIYRFTFIAGQPFTKDDREQKKKVAVITEDIAQTYFNNRYAIGEKITFQSNEYEVIGIVKNVPVLSSPSQAIIWVPYVFNKFISNTHYWYRVDILSAADMPLNEAKEKISKAVQHNFEKQNIKVDYPPEKVRTMAEESNFKMMGLGAGMAIILLLLIPAVNIVSLSTANTNNRMEEIAVRRAFGAGRLSSFIQIIMENFILVTAGAVLGILLAVPAMKFILSRMIDTAFINMSLVTDIDYLVIIIGVLPAVVIFSLLSGGLPAYAISKQNIASVLKGGKV